MKHLDALRKRGYRIRLAKDGVKIVFSPKLTESLRPKVIEVLDLIRAELQAESYKPYVLVSSKLLREVIAVGDDLPPNRVGYTWDEYHALQGASPGMVQFIHQVKKTCPGSRVENILDPRPELYDDSELWNRLLVQSACNMPLVNTALHGFRCLGARLRRSATGYHLTYDPDVEGFTDQADFDEQYRRWIMPNDDFMSRAESDIPALLRAFWGG